MKWAHPDILYALWLLLIPLLIHLLRFRKFTTLLFPDTSFLKQVERDTRRMRRLKKWLLLAVRTLLLAAVILAFAGPYIDSGEGESRSLRIIRDNSPSMTYRTDNGTVQTAITEAVQKTLKRDQTYTFWDGNGFTRLTGEEILARLSRKPLSPYVMEHGHVLRKLRQDPEPKQVTYFTDGQHLTAGHMVMISADTASVYQFIIEKPLQPVNAYIDTVYMAGAGPGKRRMKVIVRTEGVQGDLELELYTGDVIFYKRTWRAGNGGTDTLLFELPLQLPENAGTLRLRGEDRALYDNVKYYVIPGRKYYRVMIVGEDIPAFLEKIYRREDIRTDIFAPQEAPWAQADTYDVIVLYGWKNFYNFNLLQNLKGPRKIFIPSLDPQDQIFYRRAGLGAAERDTVLRRVHSVRYGHPFFEGVFTKREKQFDAPYVRGSYNVRPAGTVLLGFTGGRPYFIQKGDWYIFTGPLGDPYSDFYKSPLVIPVFYKPLWQNAASRALYSVIRRRGFVDIEVPPGEEPLELVKDQWRYVPYQERFGKGVRLYMDDQWPGPGIYVVIRAGDTVGRLALNYERRESMLNYGPPVDSLPSNVHIYSPAQWKDRITGSHRKSYSKWFVLLAVLLLLTEMFILKRK